ncbi:hypothetical protein ARALYDRAFT_477359 [Arabidopsis lyrata subsp. lyrata]|uniref:UBA domain-containing protein n=2 Tax=Arabidopsis lyrata subsp. lyrata TaxID=81972 RepID=D7L9N6_ARALL|nr:hypothetical protein ARALYDRAFT_477359 [Arabidopsis lyrata subsp. lyrata]
MDLSSSSSPPSTDFIDLMNNQDDDHQKKQVIGDDGLDSKKAEILPSYDFHPIRPTTAATRLSHSALDLAGSTTTSTAARVHWSASEFKPVSTSGFGSIEPSKLVPDKGQNVSIMSEIIDRTMKKHTDTLLHVMEGVSARLSQLESRTLNLENLVDDLKVSVDNSHGTTDGKIRQLKNILVEVQSGVQLLKDKQEILETTHQLSKVDQPTKTHSLHVDPTSQSPAPVPLHLQMPQFPITSFPHPPSSPAAPSQPPSSQLPTHFSPQQEPYFPPPPPKQPPQTQTQHQPPYQPPPSSGYNPGEQQPYPMQSYPPIPPHQQPPAGSSPSQHFYNPPQPQPSMYDGAGGRSNSGFPSGYSSEPYPYSGSPMSSAKPPHISSSGTGYSQLSNSRPLPHALPIMVSAVSSGGGSSSPRLESRAPIDDVIDRVTTMGFPRDQVRATVRKLTENGQAVDLNVVLDKLMNEGGAPPGGWFDGR